MNGASGSRAVSRAVRVRERGAAAVRIPSRCTVERTASARTWTPPPATSDPVPVSARLGSRQSAIVKSKFRIKSEEFCLKRSLWLLMI